MRPEKEKSIAFHKGQRIGSGQDTDRWQMVRKLGEGQFAEVYEVRDAFQKEADVRYAMKVEKRSQARTVRQEHRVMKRLSEQCPQICPVLFNGQLSQDKFYMIMQLLGSNLADLRRSCPGGRMEGRAVRLIAGKLLDALQAVHSAGFIHRDVKPANFAVVPGTPDVGEWRLLDFGLARRYTDDAGNLLPSRADAAFRGSTTYASINAHAGEDLSRRDDLWSWMYCVVELAEGTLPWRQDSRDVEQVANNQLLQGQQQQLTPGPSTATTTYDSYRSNVAALKQQCLADPSKLGKLTPIAGVMSGISSHLNSLGFADEPDYGLIRKLLSGLPDSWDTPTLAMIPPAGLLNSPSQLLQQQTAQTSSPVQALDEQLSDARQAGAVRNVCEYIDWVRLGGAGTTAEQLAGQLGALHPADSLSVVASVLGGAVMSTPPQACNALAALLQDVALFAQAAAKQAGTRYATWQYEQQQQQQQEQLPPTRPPSDMEVDELQHNVNQFYNSEAQNG